MEAFYNLIQILLTVIEYVVFLYLLISVLYVFIYSVAGHSYKKRKKLEKVSKRSVAVFIPAYKEDAVIVEVAKNALKQDYKSDLFDVVVIADSMQDETLEKLRSLPIIVVEVSFENSTKTKALNKAMATLKKKYDIALILDADNIMEYKFLSKINEAFENGYQIVQGHRKAKNLNTSYAILDAISEEINNHVYRRGHRALGLSSALIGSGMAFDYTLFKTSMANIKAIGGFDKELEFEMAKKRISIEYLQDAFVLDEKIQKSSGFSKQRKRWLSTQFVYFRQYFFSGLTQLVKYGNINFFDKLVQMIILPRVLLLGLTIIFTILYLLNAYFFGIITSISATSWVINTSLLFIGFLLAIPSSFYNIKTLNAMLALPSAFFRMFLLLFKLKGANKKYIHTEKDFSQNQQK